MKNVQINKKIEQLNKVDNTLDITSVIEWKKLSRAVSSYMYENHLKGANRVYMCNEWLEYQYNKKGHLKAYRGKHCRHRLCPYCSYIRTSEMIHKSLSVLTLGYYMALSNYRVKGMFLTFTMKGVSNGTDMKKGFKHMDKSINKMFRRKAISKYLLGTIKSKEMNIHTDGSKVNYNPHIHVLALFKSSFFNSKNYFSNLDWKRYYSRSMRKNYNPYMSAEKVKDSNNSKYSMLTNLSNITSYEIKPLNIMNVLDNKIVSSNEQLKNKIVCDLNKGIKNIRLISYTGIFRKANHKMILKEKVQENKEKAIKVNPDKVTYLVRFIEKDKSYRITNIFIPDSYFTRSIPIKTDKEYVFIP